MKFDDIKVGDQVIIPGGNHGVVATVERVTKTQFTAGGKRFMKDGAEHGTGGVDVWSRTDRFARHATPEAVDRLNILNRYDKFYSFVNRAVRVTQHRLMNLSRNTSTPEQCQQATETLQQLLPLLHQAADLLKEYDK